MHGCKILHYLKYSTKQSAHFLRKAVKWLKLYVDQGERTTDKNTPCKHISRHTEPAKLITGGG